MSATTLPPSPLPDVRVFGDPHLRTDGDLVALAFAADGTLWSAEDPGTVRHWVAERVPAEQPAAGGPSVPVVVSDLKAVFFVRDLVGNPADHDAALA